jgi:hypothetical protein
MRPTIWSKQLAPSKSNQKTWQMVQTQTIHARGERLLILDT